MDAFCEYCMCFAETKYTPIANYMHTNNNNNCHSVRIKTNKEIRSQKERKRERYRQKKNKKEKASGSRALAVVTRRGKAKAPTEQEKCISGAFHSANEIYLYSNQHMHTIRTLKQFHSFVCARFMLSFVWYVWVAFFLCPMNSFRGSFFCFVLAQRKKKK